MCQMLCWGLGRKKNPQTASPREEEVEKELKISISSRKGEVTYPESRAGGDGGQARLGCTFSVKKTSFSQKKLKVLLLCKLHVLSTQSQATGKSYLTQQRSAICLAREALCPPQSPPQGHPWVQDLP